jgi:hypothetical protein
MKQEDAIKFWQEQSRLMWSRVQTASVLEAGTLGSWYTTWKDCFPSISIGILVFSVILLIIVSLLMRRDAQYMESCQRFLGDEFLRPERPLFGISGRLIAAIFPMILCLANISLVFFTIYQQSRCAQPG